MLENRNNTLRITWQGELKSEAIPVQLLSQSKHPVREPDRKEPGKKRPARVLVKELPPPPCK